jgi:hypothetical protein
MQRVGEIEQPESGFPAWTGDSLAQSASESGCPISPGEMAEYMSGCQHQYCLDEEPTTFANFQLRAKFDFVSREFWVWSCEDGFGRSWDIIAGRGQSPFHNKTGIELWMHGERNARNIDPREMIAREYPEHDNSTGKAN